ncbi:MAG: PLP-dependent aminotransferase family protein [Rhodospirillales bacterium]|nr:PLP-dependent aminotransferase family protein [Rhodospirillales bacterium]
MLRPWDLKIVLDRDAVQPAFLQIVHALMEGIKAGRLAPGRALPGTRELGRELGVNRKTVQQAYEELLAQGWLTSEAKRGTFVSAALPLVDTSPPQFAGDSAPGFALGGGAPALEWTSYPQGTLVFDDGAPDTRLFPAALVARAWRRALLHGAHHNQLGYGDPRGTLRLREAVAAMLNADRGLSVTAANICITRGSQMGLWLTARLLAPEGDAVAFERLSYPPAREAFRAMGAKILPVELDEHGLVPESLEAACQAHCIRAIYVTPHHQFPTTVTMPPERRIRLLALSEQYGFVIIEDDYDHEFHFSHRPVLPLASAQNWHRLLYIGSLSKLLAPSLRLGYLVGAESAISRAGQEIMALDRQGDSVTETAVAELMEDGVVKSHARKMLRVYEERRDTLAQALRAQLGPRISLNIPQGGLALWVEYEPDLDFARFNLAAKNVAVTSGHVFATGGGSVHGARLGYGSLNNAELRQAVNRMAEGLLL